MADMNLEQARHYMIVQQIRPWDVMDQQVLDLIARTPREDFVPRQYHNLAFIDMEIPLGYGQAMMPPRLEARMLQSLAIRPEESVLEIGTGSGYVTALLAQLARQVTSVEIHTELKNTAASRLAERGYSNVTVVEGDASRGWPACGPVDVILVTGSLPVLPDELKQQLTVGGRLFVIVGAAPAMQALLITRISETEWVQEALFETVVTPLLNAPQAQQFAL